MNWVVMVILVAIGMTLALTVGRAKVGAWLTILTITALTCLGYGVISTAQAKEREDDAKRRLELEIADQQRWDTAMDVHQQCVEKAQRSNGNHAQWEEVSLELEARGATDISQFILSRLDVNLPVIDPATCPPAPAGPRPTVAP